MSTARLSLVITKTMSEELSLSEEEAVDSILAKVLAKDTGYSAWSFIL